MDERTTTEYAKRFASLRTDKSRSRWPDAICNQAPHKPLLLLSVLDLFEQGGIKSNLIELTSDLGELFARYWERVLPFGQRGNIALPFFHLRSDGFWHLLPQAGRAEILNSVSQIRSLSRLEETVLGARLDEALYELLCLPEARMFLRAILIETYFAPAMRESVVEQSTVNHEAFRYSNKLLERQTDQAVREMLESLEEYRPAVRNQGFRRAIVTVYSHRCALCGIRVRTLDGHTMVDAAHIIPWSVNHDDRPANGMALCRTCHWTFDEGLFRVSPSYEILASTQLRAATNLPGYLSNLEGCGIVRPPEEVYWPDPDSLKWHHKNVFCR